MDGISNVSQKLEETWAFDLLVLDMISGDDGFPLNKYPHRDFNVPAS